ncbi:MAG: hypothetical protein KGL29_14620, partial [Alphaproteobacteria bacterium]|nr:hypothetical protein [Alphaproteobacteria bacterium]
MKLAWETLIVAVLVAASILFIGRYQISSIGYAVSGYSKQEVYRLDRWTGKIDVCAESQDGIECP